MVKQRNRILGQRSEGGDCVRALPVGRAAASLWLKEENMYLAAEPQDLNSHTSNLNSTFESRYSHISGRFLDSSKL